MNTDTENAINEIAKAICRVKHATGDLDRCMARYKELINKPECGESGRRNESTVEETINVNFCGKDRAAKIKYPDGESPSKKTRESKDE